MLCVYITCLELACFVPNECVQCYCFVYLHIALVLLSRKLRRFVKFSSEIFRELFLQFAVCCTVGLATQSMFCLLPDFSWVSNIECRHSCVGAILNCAEGLRREETDCNLNYTKKKNEKLNGVRPGYLGGHPRPIHHCGESVGSSLVFKLMSPVQRPSHREALTVKTAQQEKPAVVMEHKTFWDDIRRIPSVGRPPSEAASDLFNRAV